MAQKYTVKNTTILHNKKTYAEGSTISLEDNEAKRLEDFVELIPNQTTTAKPQTNKTATQTQTKTAAQTKSANKTATKTEIKTETVTKDGEGKGNGEGENGGENDK